jgi:hypothetical protein
MNRALIPPNDVRLDDKLTREKKRLASGAFPSSS